MDEEVLNILRENNRMLKELLGIVRNSRIQTIFHRKMKMTFI